MKEREQEKSRAPELRLAKQHRLEKDVFAGCFGLDERGAVKSDGKVVVARPDGGGLKHVQADDIDSLALVTHRDSEDQRVRNQK